MNKCSGGQSKLEALVERLRDFSTPELCDGAQRCIAMDWQIKPQVGKNKICGPAVTVDLPPGEGALAADAILYLKKGDVLVIAGKGRCDCSYWGDHRSICASMKRAEAVVIDGAFRDAEGCEKAGFSVFAKGLTCRTAAKSGQGTIQAEVMCGGILVRPGDLILGDRNGVVVIPPEDAEEIMERAESKRRLQELLIKQMKKTGKVIPKISEKYLLKS